MIVLRTIFFAVNFTLAMFCCVGCVDSIAECLAGAGSPFALIGGILFFWPPLLVGVGEWLLFMRHRMALEQPLGVAAALTAFLAGFAFVSNFLELLVKGGSTVLWFWVEFGTICFVIAAYGGWCAWLRIRRQTYPEFRGFPVSPPE